jgi:hypothetical protein
MSEHKFQTTDPMPLQEVRFTESVAACGCNGTVFLHDKPLGLRITDIGRGVLVEREGEPDALIYPAILKRAIALGDVKVVQVETIIEPKKEEEPLLNIPSPPGQRRGKRK